MRACIAGGCFPGKEPEHAGDRIPTHAVLEALGLLKSQSEWGGGEHPPKTEKVAAIMEADQGQSNNKTSAKRTAQLSFDQSNTASAVASPADSAQRSASSLEYNSASAAGHLGISDQSPQPHAQMDCVSDNSSRKPPCLSSLTVTPVPSIKGMHQQKFPKYDSAAESFRAFPQKCIREETRPDRSAAASGTSDVLSIPETECTYRSPPDFAGSMNGNQPRQDRGTQLATGPELSMQEQFQEATTETQVKKYHLGLDSARQHQAQNWKVHSRSICPETAESRRLSGKTTSNFSLPYSTVQAIESTHSPFQSNMSINDIGEPDLVYSNWGELQDQSASTWQQPFASDLALSTSAFPAGEISPSSSAPSSFNDSFTAPGSDSYTLKPSIPTLGDSVDPRVLFNKILASQWLFIGPDTDSGIDFGGDNLNYPSLLESTNHLPEVQFMDWIS